MWDKHTRSTAVVLAGMLLLGGVFLLAPEQRGGSRGHAFATNSTDDLDSNATAAPLAAAVASDQVGEVDQEPQGWRTRELWDLSSVSGVTQRIRKHVKTAHGGKSKPPSVCLEYKAKFGLTNQLNSHWYAVVIALLVGADTIAPSGSQSRRNSNAFFFGLKWLPIAMGELWDMDRAAAQLGPMGIAVVDKCPAGNNTLQKLFPHGRTFEELEPIVAAWRHEAVERGRADEAAAPLVVRSQFMDMQLWGMLNYTRSKAWPTNLFRVAMEVWQPAISAAAPASNSPASPLPFSIQRPYGVFHFRVEADNIWINPTEQVKKWEAVASMKENEGLTWYVASGMFAKNFKAKSDDQKRALQYFHANHKKGTYLYAEAMNGTLASWMVEKRASLDLALAIDAQVFVGIQPSSFSMAAAQYRLALRANPRTYLMQAEWARLNSFFWSYRSFPDAFLKANGVTRP